MDPTGEQFPPPANIVSADVVVFGVRPDEDDRKSLQVLLVRRPWEPFAGYWALPGDYVRPQESLNAAAARALTDKTGLRPAYLEQLYTFGLPERGARDRVVSVAYYALARHDVAWSAADRPDSIRWWPVDRLPVVLAFDHARIVDYALWRLRNKVSYAHVAFQFLPPTFTLAQLREVYEVIWMRRLDPTNFRRRVAAAGTIVPTAERVAGGRHRPPQLFRCAVDPNELSQGPPA